MAIVVAMPFEVYEPARTVRGIPTVRFLSRGRVVFNAAAERLLDGVEYVRLLWDEDDLRVGFEPTDSSDSNACKLTRTASQMALSAGGFAERFGVPIGARMRVEREDNVFIAELPPAKSAE